jgi:hypothetical protein
MALTGLYFTRSFIGLPPQIKVVLFCLLVLGISQCATAFSAACVQDTTQRTYMAVGLGFTGVGVLACTIIIALFSEHDDHGRSLVPSPHDNRDSSESV